MPEESSALAEPDVADYKLPAGVRPERYEIELEPDLESSSFSGQEIVSLTIKEPTGTIVLNALDLEIAEAELEGCEGQSYKAAIKTDASNERLILSFGEHVTSGNWQLSIKFKGVLNDKLRGFYRSSYKDSQGNEKPLATTQFESTDARRAFPCWDEPEHKAVFRVRLVIDNHLTAVSNSPVESAEPSDKPGKKVVTFADTVKMSTYLLAFIVGDFECSEPATVDGVPIRIWSVPGKQHLTGFALDCATHCLAFFSRYYGIPYPASKMDLIAIPDFASGAMENLGAITFRETALLVDQQSATHAELERVADVVAHEIAHMWFGDLVTMKWWNGLWLNEAFATFMEMLAVDAWKPEWKRWETFAVSRSAALAVD